MTTDIETVRNAVPCLCDHNHGSDLYRPEADCPALAFERIERALEAAKEHEPVEMWWKLRRERAVVFRCNGVEWSMNAEEYPTVTEGWKVWEN